MGQFNQARACFQFLRLILGLRGLSWASLTRPGNPCFQFLRLKLGLRAIMGHFNQARQSMSLISEAYTGPQGPSWASLTRPGNPCLRLKSWAGLQRPSWASLSRPGNPCFPCLRLILNWASEAIMGLGLSLTRPDNPCL